MKELNDTDRAIIRILQAEGRATFAQIAQEVGLSPAAVHERVKKLEARGVITGYGPEVDPAAMGYGIQAFVLLELAQGRLAEATAALRDVPEVIEADAISGPQDVLCRLVARDTEHLQEVVNRLLATTAIRRSTSYIVLSQQVRPRTGPLVEAASRGPHG
jgi:DNA-binding Lrp family transcriptional regulator